MLHRQARIEPLTFQFTVSILAEALQPSVMIRDPITKYNISERRDHKAVEMLIQSQFH